MRLDQSTGDGLSAVGLRVGVVTAMFNERITSGLRLGAYEFLEKAGASEIVEVDAPGTFEIPLMAQRLAEGGCDAVVCLGAVIEGDTDHYEHVAHRASEGLMRVQLDTGVPIAFGILTVRTVEAAVARSEPGAMNKGREAAVAAVHAAITLRGLTTES